MVDHGKFAHAIELINVSGAESDFLLSFLSDRTQFVCMGDTVSTTSRIDKGLPQDSLALLTMFKIFVNRIFQCNFNGRLQMYADDVELLIRTANLPELSKLQSHVDIKFIVFDQMGILNDPFRRRTDRFWMELQFNESQRCIWVYTSTRDLQERSISMRYWRSWDQWFSRSKDAGTYSTTSNSGHSTILTLYLTSAILTRFGTVHRAWDFADCLCWWIRR
jgi:hypothetical protein